MVAADVRTSVEKPNLMGRPEWNVVRYADSKAPSELTVTHINQAYDLWVCTILTHTSSPLHVQLVNHLQHI